MRDDFSLSVKRICSERVAHRCSNPQCQRLTAGPQLDPSKSLNLGVCAHISAAAVGGPRYNPKLSSEERKSVNNAIWLCQYCAKLIDNDELRYPVEELLQWKCIAEENAFREIERYLQELAMGSAGVVWLWDDKRYQYRNTQTGELVDARKIIDLRDIFVERQKARIDELVRSLVFKNITIQHWVIKMREVIKSTYLASYMLATGGKKKLTETNRKKVEVMIQTKYVLMQEMAEDIVNGRYIGDDLGWVQEHIQLRARTYLDSIRQDINWP